MGMIGTVTAGGGGGGIRRYLRGAHAVYAVMCD
jgi:hypothetical protein